MKGSLVRVRASALKALLRGYFLEPLSTFTRLSRVVKGPGAEPACYLPGFCGLEVARGASTTFENVHQPSTGLQSSPANARVCRKMVATSRHRPNGFAASGYRVAGRGVGRGPPLTPGQVTGVHSSQEPRRSSWFVCRDGGNSRALACSRSPYSSEAEPARPHLQAQDRLRLDAGQRRNLRDRGGLHRRGPGDAARPKRVRPGVVSRRLDGSRRCRIGTHQPLNSRTGIPPSPDRTRIAFARVGDFGARFIWLMDADGANKAKLTSIGADHSPSWMS
jgi:hypothetical protein